MGASGSKTATRTYNAVKAGSNVVGASEQLTGAVASDAARASQQALRPVLTLEEEERLESKDAAFGNLLDRLGGSIKGNTVCVAPSQEQMQQQYVSPVADSSGRLPANALRQLLELHFQAAGGTLQADHLLVKYKVDPHLVHRALSRVCLPDVVAAEGPGGIKALADWPVWFQRHS